jgi:hypothetical protein
MTLGGLQLLRSILASGVNVGQIQLQRKLVHRANFPPVFPCPVTSGLDMTGSSGRIKRYTYFSAQPQP